MGAYTPTAQEENATVMGGRALTGQGVHSGIEAMCARCAIDAIDATDAIDTMAAKGVCLRNQAG